MLHYKCSSAINKDEEKDRQGHQTGGTLRVVVIKVQLRAFRGGKVKLQNSVKRLPPIHSG